MNVSITSIASVKSYDIDLVLEIKSENRKEKHKSYGSFTTIIKKAHQRRSMSTGTLVMYAHNMPRQEHYLVAIKNGKNIDHKITSFSIPNQTTQIN